MDILTKFEYHSKVIPGAVVVFRRVTVATRARYFESLTGFRSKLRELHRKRKPLADALEAAQEAARAVAKVEVDRLIEAESITREEAEKRVPLDVKFPDDQFLDWADLTDEITRVERDGSGIAGLRGQFISITGYTLNGKVPTVDEIIEDGPQELTDELIKTANEIAGLSATERGESPWPGTSQPPVVGPKNDSPVESAAKQPEADSDPDRTTASSTPPITTT